MNLKTKIANIELEHPIFNASGPRCTTKEELINLAKSDSSAVLSKSATLEHREGNPEPRYVFCDCFSINSMGLPNHGYKKYLEYFSELQHYNKPLIMSISGLSKEDNLIMIKEVCDYVKNNNIRIDAIELNLSCPNVPGKPQVGYDFEETKNILKEVSNICNLTWGVKLPPYFDFSHFNEMAKLLNNSSISFVTCINSLGNGLYIDYKKESVVIKPKGGFGGIGGKIIKPFALANVHKFRELLNKEISIIGVGGIINGVDIFEFILAGADAVQIGTAYMEEGPFIFSKLLKELKEIMIEKNYSNIDEFKGKLKKL